MIQVRMYVVRVETDERVTFTLPIGAETGALAMEVGRTQVSAVGLTPSTLTAEPLGVAVEIAARRVDA